jgi:hypothetical protein
MFPWLWFYAPQFHFPWESPPASAQAQASIDKLKAIQAEIERLKSAEYERARVLHRSRRGRLQQRVASRHARLRHHHLRRVR